MNNEPRSLAGRIGAFSDLDTDWPFPPVYSRFDLCLGKMLDTKTFTGNFSAPYLRNIDVQWDRINVHDLPLMDFDENERERLALKFGDLLVCEGGEPGRTAIWQDQHEECYFQKALHRLRPRGEFVDSRYFFWIMRYAVSRGHFEANGNAATIQHLPSESLRRFRFPCPPITTQRRIAAYLDRETSEIDRLIAAKERLLTLLAEKRRALITHGVTKGLNADAKASGTELPWFGFAPRHWSIRKFTHVVRITNGQVSPDDDQFSSIPLIAPNHIESGTGKLLALESAYEQAAISGKYLCKAGDVIYSKIRPALRKVTIAPQACLCSADMYPMSTTEELLPRFLFWLLLGDSFSTWAILESARVAMPKVNRESLGDLRIAVPPLKEQEVICGYIDRETKRLDRLNDACRRSMMILRERRSALIAAAVTGQISIEDDE